MTAQIYRLDFDSRGAVIPNYPDDHYVDAVVDLADWYTSPGAALREAIIDAFINTPPEKLESSINGLSLQLYSDPKETTWSALAVGRRYCGLVTVEDYPDDAATRIRQLIAEPFAADALAAELIESCRVEHLQH
ncbi:MAG TPA: hypothetical protein VNR89_17510 [Roseomonas sp.]|nr:hypothetical protein [Roseomonas sp.]